jgi:hypothetical protein
VNDLTGPVPYTLREASEYLRPAMTEHQLRNIIASLPGFPDAIGRRPTGGRPEREYDLADIQELHAALRRWL